MNYKKISIVLLCIIALIIFRADKGNVDNKKESVNITYGKIISVASSSYTDYGGGFRIKNVKDSTIQLKVVFIDGRSDTVVWKFTPGWNPEVIKTIVKSTANGVTTLYIGK